MQRNGYQAVLMNQCQMVPFQLDTIKTNHQCILDGRGMKVISYQVRNIFFFSYVNLKSIREKLNKNKNSNNLAKVIPSKQACYISFDGQEIPKENYEVLCNGNTSWVPCMPTTRTVPPFAVTAGITAAGEPLYIGM